MDILNNEQISILPDFSGFKNLLTIGNNVICLVLFLNINMIIATLNLFLPVDVYGVAVIYNELQ